MERIDENIAEVGKIMKTHGVKGEVTLAINNDALFEADCIIVKLDGLYIPFFVESRRSKGATVDIVKLEGVDSEADAAPLLGASVFLKKDQLQEEEEEWNSFEGYTIYNGDFRVGEISAIDDQTENQLFIIDTPNGEILIPIVDEWVEEVNDDDQYIVMKLPDGLLEM